MRKKIYQAKQNSNKIHSLRRIDNERIGFLHFQNLIHIPQNTFKIFNTPIRSQNCQYISHSAHQHSNFQQGPWVNKTHS